jgi:hypothetical protein
LEAYLGLVTLLELKKIYLCGISAIPPHKDIQKTALGSTESVDWEYAENYISTSSKNLQS